MTMPECATCKHPERQAIEVLLAADRPNFRQIAERFGVSKSALHRHKKSHMANGQARSLSAPGAAGSRLHELYESTERLFCRARQKGDRKTEMDALREMRAIETQIAATATAGSPQNVGKHEHVYKCRICGASGEVHFVLRYEQAEDRPDEVPREVPRSERRMALIASLATFFGVEHEKAEFLITELEKAKPEDWEQETDDGLEHQKLLVEEKESAGSDSQAS